MFWGCLGYNGAGKTIADVAFGRLAGSTAGRNFFDGKPLHLLSRSERQKIGLRRRGFRVLSAAFGGTNLLFFALAFYKVRDKSRLNALLEQTDLTAQKQGGKASFGRA